jgi:putative ABC transport system permease protein
MGADQLVVPSEYTVFLRGAGPDNTMAIVLAQPSTYRMGKGVMDRIATVPNVTASSPQLYVSTLDLPALSPDPVDIYGIDPATDFTVQPWLRKPLDHPLGTGEVIVGSEITGELATPVRLGDKTYTIVGRLDPTRSPIDRAVILSLDEAYALAAADGIVPPSAPRISPGDINAVLTRDSLADDRDAVVTRIRRALALPEYRYVSVIGRHFSLDPVTEDIRALPGILGIISVFVVIIALPLIALVSAMVANERRKEIGILMAMGAKRRLVFLLVMTESLFLAAAGGAIGLGASLLVLFLMNSSGMLNSALQVSFRMPLPAEIGAMAGIALLVVMLIGSAAALWPAWQSSRMNPYDVIRRDG